MAIAKNFQSLIKSLVWAKDKYSPIMLSGIVSLKDSEEVTKQLTTLLLAVIEYFLLIKTKQGHMMSLKVAIGDKVAVNTIIGMSVIKAAKLSLDLNNKVIEPGVFDCLPFELKFKQATRCMPSIKGDTQSSGKFLYHDNIVSAKMIEACKEQAFNNSRWTSD
eukprot:5263989-Ditylum_brightwellii.AAC.1